MILKRSILALAALMVLSACGSSYRTTYSGREESTEGVPGFVNGKKVSPHVKLGQSYTIDGETYVPRNQPDYVEEGMASWYGPGFHGGKTANGEVFDSAALTAAHRTLPLPSIVRVTMVSTGKQVYVRINDRGPFAHSRIIDLSRAAAEKIGLVRVGVAKVRVEYMAKESQRFADLLAGGRTPDSIDVASEVINVPDEEPRSVFANANNAKETEASAQNQRVANINPKRPEKSIFNHLNPVRSAQAQEADGAEVSEEIAAPVPDVDASDLSSGTAEPIDEHSPFAALESEQLKTAAKIDASDNQPPQQPIEERKPMPKALPRPSIATYYVQLGAFQNNVNAQQMKKKYDRVARISVTKKRNLSDKLLYYVRVGPQKTAKDAKAVFEKLQKAGAEVRLIKE